MRRVHLVLTFACSLLAPTPALAQAAPPTAPTAPRTSIALPPPRSLALAVTIEILSPVGGAGCFYQRRPLAGALVVAGSLIMGGALIYAARTGDRDGTIAHALGYGLLRSIGVAAATTASTPPSSPQASPDPAPPAAAPPALALRTFGLSYRVSF